MEYGKYRRFGLFAGLLPAAFAVYRYVRYGGTTVDAALFLAGLLLAATAIVQPRLFSRPYDAWMKFAALLGWLNTRIILSLVFFGMIVPAGVFARYVLGRDFLDSALEPDRDSYWKTRDDGGYDPSRLERMF